MPEGHVIHRLAGELTEKFGDSILDINSPQGRFATEAAIVDQSRLTRSDAYGKHLFIDVDANHPEHIIYIHLGLIGTLH